MPARELRESLVGALKDALGADIDPAAGRHLAVHRQAAILEITEVVPGRPCRHEEGIGDDDARRPRVRSEDGNGFARLHDECLVVLQPPQRLDDRIECLPAARRPAAAAVDDEIVGTLGDLRIEIVHQHPERRLLRPRFAGACGASRGADGTTDDAHGRCRTDVGRRMKSKNVRSRCQIEIAKFLT